MLRDELVVCLPPAAWDERPDAPGRHLVQAIARLCRVLEAAGPRQVRDLERALRRAGVAPAMAWLGGPAAAPRAGR